MKICIIHGSPRKGNTYRATQIFKEELQKGDDFQFTEFFLPHDLPHFCNGCFICFGKGEANCPHAQYTLPIANAIREADGLIITSPVYSLAETASVKAFLDHHSYLFMNHRPMEEMFSKVAMVISTTAGYGTGYAINTIRRALRFWGMRRVFSCGLTIYAMSWDDMSPAKQERFSRKLQKMAGQFYKALVKRNRLHPYLFTRFYFRMCINLLSGFPDGNPDKEYWKEKGWLNGKRRPF